MVLITDDRDGGGGSGLRVKPLSLHQADKAGGPQVQVHPAAQEQGSFSGDDEYLLDPSSFDDPEADYFVDYDEDFDELSSDTRSIMSDDSFYPPHLPAADPPERPPSACPSAAGASPGAVSLFQACCSDNAPAVRYLVRQGLGEEQATETDQNGRTALMVACYHGYVEVVMALSQCPHLDVNWQDSEGNTALITAAQAGHVTICTYLLNYFGGVDVERRNCHGFTALMKASIQGRVECVRALMMAGADPEARDRGRGLSSREWAWFTGRYDAAWTITRLLARPCPMQLCTQYSPEWPQLAALVARASAPRSCLQRVSEALRGALSFANVTNPDDHGVLDHLVTVTTGLASPFLVMACCTVCPGSPPRAGKRRGGVPEIIRRQRAASRPRPPDPSPKPRPLDSERPIAATAAVGRRRRSPAPGSASGSAPHPRTSLLSLPRPPRPSSVGPGPPPPTPPPTPPPKLRVSKAPTPTYVPDSARCRGSQVGDGGGGGGGGGEHQHLLQLPKWRYKEQKEDRRRAEEAERRRAEEQEQRRRTEALANHNNKRTAARSKRHSHHT